MNGERPTVMIISFHGYSILPLKSNYRQMNRLLIFLLCLSAQHVFSVNWKEKNLSWKTSNKNIIELHSAQFDFSTRKPRAMYKEDISDKQPVNSNIHSILKSRSVANSVLASGKWVKARTNQSGIHKITLSLIHISEPTRLGMIS